MPNRRSQVGAGSVNFVDMANTIDLSGRSAVVTGGAQGIGRAIVERLLESGAAVAIWDRDGALAERGRAVNSAVDGQVDGGGVRRHAGSPRSRPRATPP